MRQMTSKTRVHGGRGNPASSAFSLIEVALALGICSFVIVALMGLFTVGLHDSKDSGEKIEAANLASLILSARRAAPTSTAGPLANFAIPASAVTKAYGNANGGGDKFVASDGTLTTAAKAAFRIRCSVGTNAVTGSSAAMVYFLLSWPPQADPTGSNVKTYEFLSCIPLQ